jgi:hypothetical protein
MRWLFPVVAVTAFGCSAQMVNRPIDADSSPYAPTSQPKQRLEIKYLADGADFVLEARRKDAYRQMYETCAGPYRIVEEHVAEDGAIGGVVGGVAYANPLHYDFIAFECGGGGAGRATGRVIRPGDPGYEKAREEASEPR